MKPVTVVVLSKFSDIFQGFRDSVDRFLPEVPRVLVRDGEEIALPLDSRWTVVQGPEKFLMAVNGSLGWKTAPADSDLLYVGDDARFTQADTIELLQRDAYSDSRIGIISPKITGEIGSYTQAKPNSTGITYSKGRLAFVCVYIKREVIEKVGYLDPIFSGAYGCDDSDYCHRAKLAGYKLAATSSVVVNHQHAASTFIRTGVGTDCRTGAEKFVDKWGQKAHLEIEDTTAESQGVVSIPISNHVVPVRTRPLRRFSR
jgi:hypothetical protein